MDAGGRIQVLRPMPLRQKMGLPSRSHTTKAAACAAIARLPRSVNQLLTAAKSKIAARMQITVLDGRMTLGVEGATVAVEGTASGVTVLGVMTATTTVTGATPGTTNGIVAGNVATMLAGAVSVLEVGAATVNWLLRRSAVAIEVEAGAEAGEDAGETRAVLAILASAETHVALLGRTGDADHCLAVGPCPVVRPLLEVDDQGVGAKGAREGVRVEEGRAHPHEVEPLAPSLLCPEKGGLARAAVEAAVAVATLRATAVLRVVMVMMATRQLEVTAKKPLTSTEYRSTAAAVARRARGEMIQAVMKESR